MSLKTTFSLFFVAFIGLAACFAQDGGVDASSLTEDERLVKRIVAEFVDIDKTTQDPKKKVLHFRDTRESHRNRLDSVSFNATVDIFHNWTVTEVKGRDDYSAPLTRNLKFKLSLNNVTLNEKLRYIYEGEWSSIFNVTAQAENSIDFSYELTYDTASRMASAYRSAMTQRPKFSHTFQGCPKMTNPKNSKLDLCDVLRKELNYSFWNLITNSLQANMKYGLHRIRVPEVKYIN